MSEFFNAPPANPDEDTVYTMGALEGLPAPTASPTVATEAPGFDLGQFIGSAAQLAELYPGFQNRPEYEPGLSDIRYTRSFKGGEPGGSFYAPSGAGNAPAPFEEQIIYQQPILQPQAQAASNEALLSGLFDMDWSGAYQDYLNKLRAQAQDINISNVFTPTNVNYQTQTQRQQQQQSMNGAGQSQEQDSDDDSQDDGFSFQDILDSIDLGDDTTGGGLDSDFFTDTTTGGGNFVDNITLDDLYQDTIKGGNFNDSINLDDIFEGTDTVEGGNTVDTSIDTTKGTTKTDTLKGGNGNDFLNTDDTPLDFDIGRPDTVDGGNGNDSFVNTGETPAEREARLAREQEERDRQRLTREQEEGELIAREQAERDRLTSEQAAQAERERLAREQAERERLAREQAERDAQAERERLAREATVKQAYQAVLGRSDVDQEGLDYWAGQLAAGKSSTDLLRDLVSGAQGADVQAAQNTDTVSKLYQDLLGREPDAEGLSYYRSQLAAGATPEEVARNLISGAQAGSEASKISQEEYNRYFPPAPTQTGPVTNENVQNLFPNVSPGDLATVRDATDRLQAYANQYMAENAGGSFDTSLFDPETFRTNFITDVAARDPDLFSKISGLDLSVVDFGEGMLGGSALPLVTAVNAAFNSDSFADAAGNIDKAFATAGIADVAATALAAAGLPVVGQVAAAAVLLDSVLSKALGYDSPIQDGVDWMAQQTEKAMEYISDTFGDVFSSIEDFVGGIGDFFGDLFGGIGDWFAEGGLVDLPGDSMYNANTQGVLPDLMGFARGGVIPLPGGGKIAKGPGGGLDDLIPTSIDGKRAAALSDGEFVIPADVVSMMGDGSTNAGSKRLYDMVRQVRQAKTGTSRQAGPLQVGKILERTMR